MAWGPLFALVRHTLSSWVRSRAYLVLVGLAVGVVLGVPLLDELAGGEETRLMIDFSGFATSLLLSVGLSLMLIVTIGQESGDGYLLALCARPIGRSTLFFSRAIATVVAVIASNLALSALLCGVVLWLDGAHPERLLVALPVQSLEAIVVASAALALIGGSGTTEAVVITVFFYLVIRLAPAAPQANVVVRVLPRVDLIRLSEWARGEPWPPHFVDGVVHCLAWSAVLVSLGAWRFSRRDLR